MSNANSPEELGFLQAQAERAKEAEITRHKSAMSGYGVARCTAYIVSLTGRDAEESRQQRRLALKAACRLWPAQVKALEREVRLAFQKRKSYREYLLKNPRVRQSIERRQRRQQDVTS